MKTPSWLSGKKTTIIGILTILWTILSTYLLSKNLIDTEQMIAITGVLISFGLIAAKDGQTPSEKDKSLNK